MTDKTDLAMKCIIQVDDSVHSFLFCLYILKIQYNESLRCFRINFSVNFVFSYKKKNGIN